MARKSPKLSDLGTFLSRTWTVFTTVATLVLGVKVYLDTSAVSRLDAREKLDALMLDVRKNYSTFCIRETETLRPLLQDRYDALVEVAAVDAAAPPYDKPCIYFPPLGAPGNLDVRISFPSQMAPMYEDWGAFIASPSKKAALWIGSIPLTVNVESADWLAIKPSYDALVDQMNKCTSEENTKAVNTFVQLECLWGLDDDSNPQLYRVEGK